MDESFSIELSADFIPQPQSFGSGDTLECKLNFYTGKSVIIKGKVTNVEFKGRGRIKLTVEKQGDNNE